MAINHILRFYGNISINSFSFKKKRIIVTSNLLTSSLCNKNYLRTINLFILFHQWCTFNWQIRQKYYIICHVNFRSNAFTFHSTTRWPPIKGLEFLQFLDFFQQKKRKKRKKEKENFDSRRKTWGLISRVLGFELGEEKSIEATGGLEKGEGRGRRKTRGLLPHAGVAWKNEQIGWSVAGVGTKRVENEKPKTGKQRRREQRVNGKHVFVIMNVDIFIQLKRGTFRMNF